MSRLTSDRLVNRAASHPSAAARNTILILSGYLLGTAAAHFCSPMLERAALVAGLIGTLTYAVLSFLSRQKHVAHARLAIEKATVHVERRMDQHVRIASARLMLKLHAAQSWSHEQYLPVARAANSMR
jgi:hypothetical protein